MAILQGKLDWVPKVAIGLVVFLLVVSFLVMMFAPKEAAGIIFFLLFLAVLFLLGVLVFAVISQEKVPSALKELEEIEETTAQANCSNEIRGRRLYLSGDIKHHAVCLGRIVGHAIVSQYQSGTYDTYKNEDGELKYKLDANGAPIVKYGIYEDDIFEYVDGKKMLVHKKGEIKKFNESWFTVKSEGLFNFFKKPDILRVPENMHDELVGDVNVKCFSFVRVPGTNRTFIPNHFWTSGFYSDIYNREAQGVYLFQVLEDAGVILDKALRANVQHQVNLETKDNIIVDQPKK